MKNYVKVLILCLVILFLAGGTGLYLSYKRGAFTPKKDNNTKTNPDCSVYQADTCPSGCSVCPPCETCSSIKCQTEQTCQSLGFSKDWYANTQKENPNTGKDDTVCKTENCHGLDITCGSNPPDMCTEMYAFGDRCLQYATCGIVNGVCQQTENPSFTQCKTCVQNCMTQYPDQIDMQFNCEGNCK